MAGYMTKLNGHVYEGMYEAGEQLSNGVFAELDASGKVVKTTGAKDTAFRVVAKTARWGMPALVLTTTEVGKDECWFVENEWDINDNAPYDETKYAVEPGVLVRMHRPLIGEELIMTVEKALYDTLNVGDKVAPAAGGMIAAAP